MLKVFFKLLLCLGILLLVSCGQTGPLYLPQPKPPIKQGQVL